MNKSIASTQGQKNKRYSVKKPSIAHFFVSQSRLTDAVSVIFGELLSYEHPPKLRGIFYCLFLRELPFVHHWGREWLAVEVTAACGGNREPEQAQRSQRTSPAQGVQADAVTASRRLAVRPAGQKQSSGRFLERGGFYASPRICLISAKSAAK